MKDCSENIYDLYIESLNPIKKRVFMIGEIDDRNHRIIYSYTNKNNEITYYSLSHDGLTCKFFKLNKDKQPTIEMEPIGKYAAMFESPTGNSMLENEIRDFIENN